MSRQTLLATAEKLGIPLPDGGRNDRLLSDPMKGPILKTIREKLHPTSSELESAIKRRMDLALKAVDGLSKREMPPLPCNLEDAVRFLTGEKAAKWNTLELAFLEWLVFKTSQDNDYYERMEEQLVKGRLKEFTQVKKAFPERRDYASAAKATKNALNELNKIRKLRSPFTPGSVINDPSLNRLAENRQKRWLKSRCVGPKEMLELLECDFRGFWSSHSSDYQEISLDYTKTKNAKSKQKAAAARSGVDAREHAKWLNRTKELIEFTGASGLPKDPDQIASLLEKFAEDLHGLRSPRAKEANLIFFQTLIAHMPKSATDPVFRSIYSQLCPSVRDFDDSHNRNFIRRRQRRKNTDVDPEIEKRLAQEQRKESRKKQGEVQKLRSLFKSMTKEIVKDCYSELVAFHARVGNGG